jgi:ATP-binding cassette, subfamily A (ABC1), member 3
LPLRYENTTNVAGEKERGTKVSSHDPTQPRMEAGNSNVAALFSSLEEKSEELGVAYYGISRATLDQVFLSIVGKHNIEEEGAAKEGEGGTKQRKYLKFFPCF